jgi:hypothetical protein
MTKTTAVMMTGEGTPAKLRVPQISKSGCNFVMSKMGWPFVSCRAIPRKTCMVPSVTMKGGMRPSVMINPFARPQSAPARTITSTTGHIDQP